MKVSVILALCAGAGMILGLLSGSAAVALLIYYFLELEKDISSHMNTQTTQAPSTVFSSSSSSYLATSSIVILPSTSSQGISSTSSTAAPSSYTASLMSPSPTVSQGIIET